MNNAGLVDEYVGDRSARGPSDGAIENPLQGLVNGESQRRDLEARYHHHAWTCKKYVGAFGQRGGQIGRDVEGE
jgi:hypothetical protein